jgi:glycosyltransferase involved in cell wall biosynthesis
VRIAIDTTAMPRNRAGAGVYTYHLTRALAAALPPGDRLTVFDRRRAFPDLGSTPAVDVRSVALAGRGRRIVWEQSGLPWALHHADAEVFHAPHHSVPLLPGRWKTVATVHDVTFSLLPWRYTPARRLYMAAVTALAARRADRFIVPSVSVARDFARLFRVADGRIAVVPEAPPPSMRVIEDADALAAVRRRLDLPPRFVLSVGTLEPGKNRGALLRAAALLRARRLPHALVIAGQRGWRVDEPGELARRLGISGAVRHLGYVPDTDLPALYNLAEAFVFPSWREGFGLPPLEAMACGTPVVASNRPAMPEVLGGAALFAAPNRPDAIADALERLLTDRELHERLRRQGIERAAAYTWERAARETLGVYRDAWQRPLTPTPSSGVGV